MWVLSLVSEVCVTVLILLETAASSSPVLRLQVLLGIPHCSDPGTGFGMSPLSGVFACRFFHGNAGRAVLDCSEPAALHQPSARGAAFSHPLPPAMDPQHGADCGSRWDVQGATAAAACS